MFRDNEIVVLIGAGCSAEADVCTSQSMVGLLDSLVTSNKAGWKE